MKMQFFFLIIISISIIIISIFLAGCTDNEDGEIDSLDIHIGNISNSTYNATLVLIDSNGYKVFNQSFTIELDENIEYNNITEKIGNYKLILSLDDGRIATSDDISVNEFRHMVGIDIKNDDIDISQKLK